jgi:ADP-heptose:LPS heptosyltransferase
MIDLKNPVLYQPWGGLGDNLQFSTLPRRFAELGNGANFSISNKNVYRNDEIKKMVWDANPFISDTMSSMRPNCGSMAPEKVPYDTRNIIEWNEARHGFEPKNSLPEIHFEPQQMPGLNNVIVLDLGAQTTYQHARYTLPILVENINNILKEHDGDRVVLVKSKYNKSPIDKFYADLDTLTVRDIFHYASIVKNCKRFICVYSGSTVLASCLREQDTICLYPDRDSLGANAESRVLAANRAWIFPNVLYMAASSRVLNDLPEWKF